MIVYLASPIFSQPERLWNRRLAELLEKELGQELGEKSRVVLPQDFREKKRFNARETYPHLFKRCLAAIEKADAVVAVLDGADADSGTAFEVGYACAKGVPVVGVRTDFRRGQDRGVNVMCGQACAKYVYEMSFREKPDALARAVAVRLKAAVAGRKK